MRREAVADEQLGNDGEGHSGVVAAPAKGDAAGFALTLPEASEELRTNVNTVVGFAELLDQGIAGKLNEQQREFVRHLLEAGQRLRELVERTGCRVDLVEPPTGSRQWIDVTTVLERVVATLQSSARVKGVDVSFTTPTLEPLFIEPSAVLQVLHNVIFNTMDAAILVSRISIRVTEENRAVVIHVDTACDLENPTLDRVLAGPLPVASLRRIIEFHGIRLVRPEALCASWALRIPYTPGLRAPVKEEGSENRGEKVP